MVSTGSENPTGTQASIIPIFRAGQLGPHAAIGRGVAGALYPGRSRSHLVASSQLAARNYNPAKSGQNNFVAYVDAVGEPDGTGCPLQWKTTASRYPEGPTGLMALDPQLVCYSWGHELPMWRKRIRPQAAGRDSVLPDHDQVTNS